MAKNKNNKKKQKAPGWATDIYRGFFGRGVAESDDNKFDSFSDYWMDSRSKAFTQKRRTWSQDIKFNGSKLKEGDLLLLMNNKKAIRNFVSIISNSQVDVDYAVKDENFAVVSNGRPVVRISPDVSSGFDSIVGAALHESAHIQYSSRREDQAGKFKRYFMFTEHDLNEHPQLIADLVRATKRKFKRANKNGSFNYQKAIIKTVAPLQNWLEDRRIDKLIIEKYPGYSGYYNALYNKYFFKKNISDSIKNKINSGDVNSYIGAIIYSMNKKITKHSLAVLPEFNQILKMVDEVETLNSTEEVFQLTKKIYKKILSFAAVPPPLPPPPPSDQKQQGDDGEAGDAEDNESGDGSSSDDSGDSDDEDETGSSSSGDLDDSDDEDETGSSSSDDGDDSDDEDETGSSSSDDSDDEDETGSSSSDDGDDSDDEDESSGGSNSNQSQPSAEDVFNDGFSSDDVDQDIKDLLDQMDSDETPGNVDLKSKKKKDSLLKTDAKMLEAVTNLPIKLGFEYIGKEKDIAIPTIFVDASSKIKSLDEIIKALTNRLRVLGALNLSEAIKKGKRLSNNMLLRNEERETVFNNLRKGKIDNRALASISYDNETIFCEKLIDRYKTSLLLISVDGSHSMSDGQLDKALKMAATLASASYHIPNLDVAITIRYLLDSTSLFPAMALNMSAGDVNKIEALKKSNGYNYPTSVLLYDSRKNNIKDLINIGYAIHYNTTPEALLFNTEAENIFNKNDQNNYFINLTDGDPYASPIGLIKNNHVSTGYSVTNYSFSPISFKANSTNHTKKVVDGLKRKGILFLSYFIQIGNSGDQATFEKMYGKSGKVIDVDSIPAISKTINELLLTEATH